jgi:uncharacterized integral membrane protein
MVVPDEVDGTTKSPASRRQQARLVLLGVAGVAQAWFAVGNLGSVSIDFWVRHSRQPLILVILISGLLGALIAAMALRHRAPKG